ncbi:MAG: phosphatase PAP2 family protein [Ornithinimicrobium sp.]
MTRELPAFLKKGRGLGLAIATALITGGLAVIGALALDLPLRDPDGFLGPSWTRLPAILFLFIAADVVPRIVRRRRQRGGVRPALREVIAERWPLHRLIVVIIALASFYVTYVGYRNLKSFLPTARIQSEDMGLRASDQLLSFGANPAEVLHTVLGTGVSAHVLSWVYISFLFFVPISLAAMLVWSKNVSLGLWYTTALCLNWALGTASYYLLPALGPFAVRSWNYSALPETGVSQLQQGMLNGRARVIDDPFATNSVQSIAAFASLHTSIIFTAALIVHLAGFPKILRVTMWVFMVLTLISTIYFGWHYLIDDIAGLVIGAVSVSLAWYATRDAADHLPSLTPKVSPELASSR